MERTNLNGKEGVFLTNVEYETIVQKIKRQNDLIKELTK